MGNGESPEQESRLIRALWGLQTRWRFALVVACGLLAGWHVLRVEIEELVKPIGNTASVLGLVAGIAGFGLTICALLETARIGQESRQKIREAIEKAEKEIAEANKAIARTREETRQLVGRIQADRFQGLCNEAYRFLLEAASAIREGLWKRAAERLENGRAACIRLAESGVVLSGERDALASALGDLTTTIRFIWRNRLE